MSNGDHDVEKWLIATNDAEIYDDPSAFDDAPRKASNAFSVFSLLFSSLTSLTNDLKLGAEASPISCLVYFHWTSRGPHASF
jgi:hypothetical protein